MYKAWKIHSIFKITLFNYVLVPFYYDVLIGARLGISGGIKRFYSILNTSINVGALKKT